LTAEERARLAAFIRMMKFKAIIQPSEAFTSKQELDEAVKTGD
jgi:hypothetical protein